ncbi:MAG: tRNA-guanine transglycosylase, partial [Thermoplasmata archaeon]|nr:tRNA-guanine transglycosylase [Thermoplasmata archaeon]
MVEFEIKDRDAVGRIGILKTAHGKITTPALLPVINPNKTLIEPKEMKRLFGAEIVITNSYIIYNNKNLREKALSDGVHLLIDFDGAIMTDSGTFQSYVYNDIDVDPFEIVDFQRDIGSDIGTILDVFTTP